MNKEAFLKVVNNVKEISDHDLENLLESSKFYPYCQSIHILIAKKYHDLQHGLAPAKLHKAAIYSTDRLFLKRIMEDDPSIKKFVKSSAVTPEIEQVSESNSSDTHNFNEEIVPADNIVETVPEEENKELSAFSEKVKEDEATEKVGHQEESYKNSAEPESLPSSTNNLTHEPEITKEEVVDEKEDIHAELQKNIQEYKERRLKESQQTKEIIEADNSGEPVVEEDLNSSEINSVKENLKNIETSGGIESSDVQVEEGEIKEEQNTLKDSENEVVISSEKSFDQHQLIENFIRLNPSLSRFDLKFDEDQKQIEDLSIPKLTIGEHLISENLAVILHKQGKVQKAINIYEKLILKFPEKKAYFASCIEKIKNPS